MHRALSRALDALPGAHVRKVSRLYQTKPVGVKDQPDFLNAVIAVDVGYGQLDWGIRNEPRVVVMERTNIRNLRPDDLPWAVDGVVADRAP